jgi:exodeoxyribonuclease VII large subunit
LPLPVYPERIAVITASTGEAIHDIISTFNRRFPLAKIKLYPALVQGVDAPKDLVRALLKVYEDNDADAIIIGRGGGSFEDLSCFNDEILARTLFASRIPTVSAVGHEGDYTICDFVCSFRAPTPTGAAMKLTKEKKDVNELVLNYSKRLSTGIKNKLTQSFNSWNSLNTSYGLSKFDEILGSKEQLYNNLNNRLMLLSPDNLAKNLEDKIVDLTNRLNKSVSNYFNNINLQINGLNSRLRSDLVIKRIENEYKEVSSLENKMNLLVEQQYATSVKIFNHLVEKCTILNPLNIIKKGYTIVYKDEDIVYNVDELNQYDEVKIKFNDGVALATVNEIIKDEE